MSEQEGQVCGLWIFKRIYELFVRTCEYGLLAIALVTGVKHCVRAIKVKEKEALLHQGQGLKGLTLSFGCAEILATEISAAFLLKPIFGTS